MTKRKKRGGERQAVGNTQPNNSAAAGEGSAPSGGNPAYANVGKAAEAYARQAAAPQQEKVIDLNAGGGSADQKIAELEKQRDEYLALAQRTKADLENYRKRVMKEAAQRKREALGGFLRDLLPAFHEFDRVISEGENKQDYETFHQGVKLVYGNLAKTFEKVGVRQIEALGQPFNPEFHEAMTMVPSPDHEPNTVIEVFQTGYMFEDFVLIPARVIVSCAAPAAQ